jgi:hypothetical protein
MWSAERTAYVTAPHPFYVQSMACWSRSSRRPSSGDEGHALGAALGYGLFVAGPAYGVAWRRYCGDPPHAVPLAYDTLNECREEYEEARQLLTNVCKDYPLLQENLCSYVFKLGSTCICQPEAVR